VPINASCVTLTLGRFAPQNLNKIPSLPSYATVIEDITATDATRLAFMRLILGKLGLAVNEQEQAVPSLSRLHLTAHNLTDVSDLVASWSEIRTVIDGDEYVKGENDVFRIEKEGSAWGMKEMKRAVSAMSDKLPTLASITNGSGAPNAEMQGHEKGSERKKPQTKEERIQECIDYTANTIPDQITEYEKIVKVIVPHEKELPSPKETPFHHEAFYANLHYSAASPTASQ
jgi:biotin--protein ligase